jgi:hypothetical protein
MTYREDLQTVGDGIAHCEAMLAQIEAALRRFEIVTDLDQATGIASGLTPVWPALPTERLARRRDGTPGALSLVWGKDSTTGQYRGPYGAQSVYIGTDPARQALARELIRSTYRRRLLLKAEEELAGWLNFRTGLVGSWADHAENWRDYLPDVSLPEGGPQAGDGR